MILIIKKVPNFISILINININFINMLACINMECFVKEFQSVVKISLILVDECNVVECEGDGGVVVVEEDPEAVERLVVAVQGILELPLLVEVVTPV